MFFFSSYDRYNYYDDFIYKLNQFSLSYCSRFIAVACIDAALVRAISVRNMQWNLKFSIVALAAWTLCTLNATRINYATNSDR